MASGARGAIRRTRRRALPAPTRAGRLFAAEVLGLCVYVLLGGGTEAAMRAAAYQAGKPLGADAYVLIGLAHGFALFVMTAITHNVSGAHVNPAVTVGLASAKRFPWRGVPLQVAGQLLGALLGAAAILIVLGRTRALRGALGAAVIAPHVGLIQGLAIEALGAAILMLTVLATSGDPRSPGGWGAFSAGMAVVPITMTLAPATSALVNPARALGPEVMLAILGGHTDWTVLLVMDVAGPLLGALVACQVYRAITGAT